MKVPSIVTIYIQEEKITEIDLKIHNFLENDTPLQNYGNACNLCFYYVMVFIGGTPVPKYHLNPITKRL
jgi:hypothetical protein